MVIAAGCDLCKVKPSSQLQTLGTIFCCFPFQAHMHIPYIDFNYKAGVKRMPQPVMIGIAWFSVKADSSLSNATRHVYTRYSISVTLDESTHSS